MCPGEPLQLRRVAGRWLFPGHRVHDVGERNIVLSHLFAHVEQGGGEEELSCVAVPIAPGGQQAAIFLRNKNRNSSFKIAQGYQDVIAGETLYLNENMLARHKKKVKESRGSTSRPQKLQRIRFQLYAQ